jgi:hypothetical protein
MGQRPSYVDSLVNISERAAISKIRTCAHLLMIERGRHCTVCKPGKIENEEQFLIHCPGCELQRQIFVNKIVPGYIKLSTVSKIKLLLNSNSSVIRRMSSSFISSCFKNRDNLM